MSGGGVRQGIADKRDEKRAQNSQSQRHGENSSYIDSPMCIILPDVSPAYNDAMNPPVVNEREGMFESNKESEYLDEEMNSSSSENGESSDSDEEEGGKLGTGTKGKEVDPRERCLCRAPEEENDGESEAEEGMLPLWTSRPLPDPTPADEGSGSDIATKRDQEGITTIQHLRFGRIELTLKDLMDFESHSLGATTRRRPSTSHELVRALYLPRSLLTHD